MTSSARPLLLNEAQVLPASPGHPDVIYDPLRQLSLHAQRGTPAHTSSDPELGMTSKTGVQRETTDDD